MILSDNVSWPRVYSDEHGPHYLAASPTGPVWYIAMSRPILIKMANNPPSQPVLNKQLWQPLTTAPAAVQSRCKLYLEHDQ